MEFKFVWQLLNFKKIKIICAKLCIIVLSLLWLSGSAQNNSLHGIIEDEKTATPLEKVTIELHEANDSSRLLATFTNNNGSFSLNKIQQGNYYIFFFSESCIISTNYCQRIKA